MLRLTSLLAAVFALSAGASQAATKNVHVGKNGGFNFVAANVTINQGDAVHWIWDTGFHSVTSGSPGSPDSQFGSINQSAPATFDHTFSAPGVYHYYCSVHGAAMVGSVRVLGPDTP